MAKKRPNILMIFPDQHRTDVAGHRGNPVAKTPNLDQLAAEGVVFDRCITNSPLCMPARAALVSGQHVRQNGVWTNSHGGVDTKAQSHVRNMRDSGYHTAVLGKTHLYMHGIKHADDKREVLEDLGYEDIHELTGPLASFRMNSAYTDYLEERGLLQTHRDSIKIHREQMQAGRAWNDPPCPLPTDLHLDSYTGWQAINWLRNYNSEKPFYYQVCFPGPHDPYDAPAEYREMYDLKDIPMGITTPPKGPISPLVQFFLNRYENNLKMSGWTRENRQQMKLNYYAKYSLIDYWIGQIMHLLRTRNLLENTWVIYTTDHGDFLSDRNLIQKMMFFNEALSIPLIIRPPGGVKRWDSQALCDHVDIAATVLDIAGATPMQSTPGRSLLQNIMAGASGKNAHQGRNCVFSEVYGFTMALTDRWKMSVNAATGEVADLYDMQQDPQELRNLVNEPSLENVRRELLHDCIEPLKPELNVERLQRIGMLDLKKL